VPFRCTTFGIPSPPLLSNRLFRRETNNCKYSREIAGSLMIRNRADHEVGKAIGAAFL
jgi:hypothetical protein